MSLLALKKLIPWSELGYEVTGTFSCSDDAIEFLANNSVDVVITDICMPKPDGLDLVELCHKEHSCIKIILLSAYRDFEYAQKALRYENVVDYITKPADYKSVVAVLKKIASNTLPKNSFFSSENDIYIRLQFFSNLLCGNITEADNLMEQFSTLGINLVPEEATCTFVVFQIRNFNVFLEKTSKYNSVQLYNAITNLHPFITHDGYFSLALYSYGNIAWLIIHQTENPETVTESFASSMIENFRSIWNVDATVSSCRTYSSILELVNVQNIDDTQLSDTSDNEIINSAIDYINEHLNENISLDEVARHVFMCPPYFSSYFKKKTGERFIDRLTSIRMERAAHLLANDKNISVTEVCNMIGYNHLGYFYRKFKQFYGVTPTEYRTKAKK